MKAKQYAQTKKDDLPPLLQAGDSFKSISKLDVKTIDYQGKPTEVATLTTDLGLRSTFSQVVIKNLTEFFDEHPGEMLEDVRVVQPRGKKYLTLEGI